LHLFFRYWTSSHWSLQRSYFLPVIGQLWNIPTSFEWNRSYFSDGKEPYIGFKSKLYISLTNKRILNIPKPIQSCFSPLICSFWMLCFWNGINLQKLSKLVGLNVSSIMAHHIHLFIIFSLFLALNWVKKIYYEYYFLCFHD
jgi:hypothetical protein